MKNCLVKYTSKLTGKSCKVWISKFFIGGSKPAVGIKTEILRPKKFANLMKQRGRVE